jgi:hypothetical protein
MSDIGELIQRISFNMFCFGAALLIAHYTSHGSKWHFRSDFDKIALSLNEILSSKRLERKSGSDSIDDRHSLVLCYTPTKERHFGQRIWQGCESWHFGVGCAVWGISGWVQFGDLKGHVG